MITIRLCVPADEPAVLDIYDSARAHMRAEGNMRQWTGGYPNAASLERDMAAGRAYVMEDDGLVFAAFCLLRTPEPTYNKLYEGSWLSPGPYVTLHRVASDGSHRGVMARAVAFAAEACPHVRVDTHRDNRSMQRALTACGFNYRGIIYLADGAERLAFERL